MMKSQLARIFASICDLFIVAYLVFAMFVLPIRPGFVVPVMVVGFLLCMAADVATSEDPKVAVQQPLRWLRSVYLNVIVVGAIMLGWRYFDEGYEIVTIGLVVLGILIGEYVFKLRLFSLLCRMLEE